jgi:tight adherence protein C
MILVLLIALSLIGLSVMLVLRVGGLADPRRRQALEHIDGYGFNAELAAPGTTRSGGSQRLASLATVVGDLYSRYARSDREREIRELLRSAGLYRMSVATFLGYRVLAAVGTALFLLWLLGAAGGGGVAVLLVVATFGALGWLAPMFILRRRAAYRLQQIDREVPELVDLLVTTVEAGVGFASALQITARRVEGPLGEELRVALSEQGLGLTIQDALKNMLTRANSPALRVFVQAIIQGDTLGVSIGKILRDLAIDMRKRRRQAAEERAQKAPTKIIFPLVLLILPAMFIVAVWPIVYSFLHGLGG